MHHKRIAGMSVAACLIWQSLLQVAHAQEDQAAPDRFRVFAGQFFANMETDSAVTVGSRGGRDFSLEDDLGLKDDDQVFVGGLRWRFGKRSSLGILHVTLDRDADENLTRELSIGDQTFTINATTMTTFDYETTHVEYRYAFYSTDRLDAGLLLGLSNVDFDLEVVAATTLPGGGAFTQSVHEAEGFPVPSIGLGFRYALKEDFYLRAGATYFAYDDGDWDASMLLAGVGVEWFPWRHFGFGLGYDFVEIEYDENNDPEDDEFDVKFDYDGIQFRVIGRF